MSGPVKLLDWLVDPPADRGIRIAEDGDHWQWVGYEELALQVRRAATELRTAGLQPGGVVSIVVGSIDRFIVSLFGSLLAGGVPSPAAPPLPLQSRDLYAERLTNVLGHADPSVVICDPAMDELVTEALQRTPHRPSVIPLTLQEDPTESGRMAEGLALVQFTSGSSSSQRGIPISVAACEAQIQLLSEWLGITSDDAIGGWLPMHHDMGLIGCCLTPIMLGLDLFSMKPEQFVADPSRWLSMFGTHHATMSATPNFGLEYTLRRISDEDVADMDFAALRALIIGAERVDPAVLRRFTDRLRVHGLDEACLRPAYGMAEATLAVSGRVERPLRIVRPDAYQMEIGRSVDVLERSTLTDADLSGGAAGWVPSCGPALGRLTVEVVDDTGEVLPEGRLGEIRVAGPSVADHYLPGSAEGSTRFDEAALLTGDCGFLDGGELFVMSRLGDSLKVRGRHVFAEDVEAKVAAEVGLPIHLVAIVLGRDAEREQAGLVIEVDLAEDAVEQARRAVRRETNDPRPWVAVVARGVIPRTSSGKVQRRRLWSSYLAGELDEFLDVGTGSTPVPEPHTAPAGQD